MDVAPDFAGKTAIVTGATGGVGGAIAARLIEAGMTTVLLGRSQAALERMVEESGWNTERVRCQAVDLAAAGQVASVASQLAAALHSVDVLVHAAGVIVLGGVETAGLEDFDRQYQVNIRAPYQLTQALLPSLKASEGQVVFINSSAGISANKDGSQYGASKHALRALADSLRQEINPSGVRVLSVFLGRTASRMQAAVHQHEGRPYRPELLLQPDDVAAMVMQALALPRTAEVTDIHIRPMRKA